MKTVRAVTILAAVAVLGCGPQEVADPGEGPPPSNGLNPTEINPGGAGASCHAVGGAGLVQDQRAASVPALTGGAMVDGRYVLTRYEWYTPNQLHVRSIVLVVSGGGTQGQYYWQRNNEPEQRMTLAISTAGERISMVATCPGAATLEWDRYSTADGGLTLFSTGDSKAAFFARQ
jgi:hypothetical protein